MGQTPALHPSCHSTTSVLHPLVPSSNTGWEEWAFKEKKYWKSDTPGSRISFKLNVEVGIVRLMYLRSKDFGLGVAHCWIEGDEKKWMRVVGYWTALPNILQ